MTRSHFLAPIVAFAVALAPLAVQATDGSSAPPPPPPPPDGGSGIASLSATTTSSTTATYYESAVGSASATSLETTDPTLPTHLVIDDATAVASYRPSTQTASVTAWQLRIDGFERRHEQVDGIYDMVLVLPLPTANGRDAFAATKRGFFVEEGGGDAAVPLIYGGEKVVLKRNVGLEKSLIGQLVGPNGLPDLGGSGYRWTAWDTIIQRDPAHEDTVQARGHLEYTTPSSVTAPDPADPRMAAYLITWIPGLPASIPPFCVRMDVAPASQ